MAAKENTWLVRENNARMEQMILEEMMKKTYEKVQIHQLINFDRIPEKEVKVSIVIPVYNVEQYLRECLDSAVNQTLQEIEIICVNDGSTDGSLEILKEYAKQDSRVKVVDKDNAGYGHTMNLGMDMACGEYIGIIESDDYVDLHMYEDLYVIAKNNDVDIIKTDFNRFIIENGAIQCSYISVAWRDRKIYNKIVNPESEKQVFKLVMQTWCGIYRKDFLIENGIRYNESPGASYQDNGFWFQTLIYAEKVYFYNKPYYMNRRDNPNSSVYNRAKVYCINQEYDFIRRILENDIEKLRLFLYQYSYKKFLSYLFSYNRIADEFKWNFLQVFHMELNTADENNEIEWELWDENIQKDFELILMHPEDFYANDKLRRYKENIETHYKDVNIHLKKQNAYLKEQIGEKQRYIFKLWNSTSYKVGRFLTWLPRTIKDKRIINTKEEHDNSNNIVHVAFICDENYVMPTTVALTSIKINKRSKTIYKIHLLLSNVSSDLENMFLMLNSKDFQIDLRNVMQDERLSGMIKGDGDTHVTSAATIKFQLADILKDVGKVLYLDGDVLVQRDLRELYNINIPGKYAAVVKDILSERNPAHLRFLKYKGKYYFNSGMMLLNLTKIRKDNIIPQLVDYRLNGINHFNDQDAFNVVFKENVLYISPQYNFLNKFFEWWSPEKLSVFYGENIPVTEKAAYKKAAILHLGSHEKPWIYKMGYLTKLYKHYYKKSPYGKVHLNLKKIR